MPSSRSSLDKRDIYYRLHKSAGYRARSAYKLLHLDEEFDLFGGVKTVVDLCAAPGSWSQVVAEKLGSELGSGEEKLVSLDLQPMAPLRNTITIQADLTTPCTIPLVLSHLANKKADLVICDGAPDVTGVHDLDAYLHHQLLMAAFTLTLAILAKGGTAVYKVFLSPLDPKGERLREGMKVFFRAEDDHGEWLEEYDEDEENVGTKGSDGMGRRGGVWVRKPRSSRKGSGEAFIVCRNYDPSTVPLPSTFSPASLEALEKQTSGTLTLESLADLAGDDIQLSEEQTRRWEILKAWAGKGDLNPKSSNSVPGPSKTKSSPRTLDIDPALPIPLTPPAPLSPTLTRTEPTPGSISTQARSAAPLSLVLPPSSLVSRLTPPRPTPDIPPKTRGHRARRSSIESNDTSPTSPNLTSGWDRLGPSPLPSPISPYPPNLGDQYGSFNLRQEYPIPPREPYALSRYVAPDLYTEPTLGRPRADTDGAISPALSTASKTDMFFGSAMSGTGSDILPAPPRPLGESSSTGGVGALLGRAGSIGRSRPSLLSGERERERERAVTMPTTPVGSGTVTPMLPPSDLWSPSKALEASSAPSGSRSHGLGIGSSGPAARDRRLSGAGRVISIGQNQSGYGRERTDSINSTTERIMAKPLTGLPSGESLRSLAATPNPTSRSQMTAAWARRESQIERETHQTTGDQEDLLSPGDILEPLNEDERGLEGINEDLEMRDEEGEVVAPLRPKAREDIMGSFSGALPAVKSGRQGKRKRKWMLEKKLGEGAFSAVWAANAEDEEGKQVEGVTPVSAAIKLLPRRLTASNDRTRISFLREVGVLSRLSHPSIVGFIDDFETQGYYCLALERVDGGELFDVIQNPKWSLLIGGPSEGIEGLDRGQNGEVLIRRIFSELLRATGFLHACGVVHRDIKLENILLTSNPLKTLPSSPSLNDILAFLPPTSQPLIKLTDFGLSRFISPSSPHLSTRCGSESFAAPEIIMGKPYDGRDTDSWACGVVLYAMLTGELPFDPPIQGQGHGQDSEEAEKEERRRRMLKIAKGSYSWPKGGMGSKCSEGVKNVVKRLLVRDPRKRARVDEVWEEDWMKGQGSVGAVHDVDAGAESSEGETGKKRVLDGWLVLGATDEED